MNSLKRKCHPEHRKYLLKGLSNHMSKTTTRGDDNTLRVGTYGDPQLYDVSHLMLWGNKK